MFYQLNLESEHDNKKTYTGYDYIVTVWNMDIIPGNIKIIVKNHKGMYKPDITITDKDNIYLNFSTQVNSNESKQFQYECSEAFLLTQEICERWDEITRFDKSRP